MIMPTNQTKIACPECGSTDDWVAYYYVGRKANVDIFQGDDGTMFADGYDCDESVDDDVTEDLEWRCTGCDKFYTVASLTIEPVKNPLGEHHEE